MRCKHCNNQINNSDLYCPKCRKKTQSIKENFLIWSTFKESYTEVKNPKNYSFSFNLIFAGITFILLLLLVLHYSLFQYDNDWVRYIVENLIFITFVPILLIPFGIQNVIMEIGYGKALNKYMIKKYPKFLLFTLVNVVIFALFKFVTIGDPVLRLVRLVLVLWWLAVLLPIPVLLTKYNKNLFKLHRIALKAFEDLRWQLFFGYLLIFMTNLIMIIPLFLGYLKYGNLPYLAMHSYIEKIEKNELLDEYL